jgi:hypothetical protein
LQPRSPFPRVRTPAAHAQPPPGPDIYPDLRRGAAVFFNTTRAPHMPPAKRCLGRRPSDGLVAATPSPAGEKSRVPRSRGAAVPRTRLRGLGACRVPRETPFDQGHAPRYGPTDASFAQKRDGLGALERDTPERERERERTSTQRQKIAGLPS